MAFSFDIAIIGGGFTGPIQAILLGNQGHNVICIDRETTDIQTELKHGATHIRAGSGLFGQRILS